MASEVILIFGTFFFGGMTDEEVLGFLDVLEGHGVSELDTARIYVGLVSLFTNGLASFAHSGNRKTAKER